MTGYFEFANPTRLCAGKGAIGNLAYELKMLQVMRPMILSDAVLAKIGTLHMVLDALREVRIGRIFTDIPRDSSIETVNRIAQEYRDYGCDGIVAVGGGSVLDTAKGVRLLISQGDDNLLDRSRKAMPELHYLQWAIPRRDRIRDSSIWMKRLQKSSCAKRRSWIWRLLMKITAPLHW